MKQKTKEQIIPLTVGVLIFSFLSVLSISAWTEPSQDPPSDNIQTPVNVGSVAQTKSGALTVTDLTLDNGNEGDLHGVDQIIGYNDLRLCRDAVTCSSEIADADLWIDASGNINILNAAFVVGDSGTPACLKLRDADNAGWTYCTFLNGSINCSTTSCE